MTIKERNLFLKMLFTQDTNHLLITVVTKGFYVPAFSIKDFQLNDEIKVKQESLIQESIPEVSIVVCLAKDIQKYVDGYTLLGFDMNSIREVEISGFIEKNGELERDTKFIGGLRPVIIKGVTNERKLSTNYQLNF